jgi:CDP-paratose 2-epimerase
LKILVTGVSGLIGSSIAEFYLKRGNYVVGLDDNSREKFFGPTGSNYFIVERYLKKYKDFNFYNLDINSEKVSELIRVNKFNAVINCAAQPSHDKAAEIPREDFNVNAMGVLNLLEAIRKFSEDSIFVQMSTNKVYGDNPNSLELTESELRFDFKNPEYFEGIDENFPIDHTTHSLFGVSKLYGDLITQEYGRYFGLKTVCFRGGCLTGVKHAGVQQHGFLSYFNKSWLGRKPYTVFGYKGKQVRDQIHSVDVAQAINLYIENPLPGKVYNLGGGKANSASILELIDIYRSKLGYEIPINFENDHRKGDHICYYSNMSLFEREYPKFKIEYNLDQIIEQMIGHEKNSSDL